MPRNINSSDDHGEDILSHAVGGDSLPQETVLGSSTSFSQQEGLQSQSVPSFQLSKANNLVIAEEEDDDDKKINVVVHSGTPTNGLRVQTTRYGRLFDSTPHISDEQKIIQPLEEKKPAEDTIVDHGVNALEDDLGTAVWIAMSIPYEGFLNAGYAGYAALCFLEGLTSNLAAAIVGMVAAFFKETTFQRNGWRIDFDSTVFCENYQKHLVEMLKYICIYLFIDGPYSFYSDVVVALGVMCETGSFDYVPNVDANFSAQEILIAIVFFNIVIGSIYYTMSKLMEKLLTVFDLPHDPDDTTVKDALMISNKYPVFYLSDAAFGATGLGLAYTSLPYLICSSTSVGVFSFVSAVGRDRIGAAWDKRKKVTTLAEIEAEMQVASSYKMLPAEEEKISQPKEPVSNGMARLLTCTKSTVIYLAAIWKCRTGTPAVSVQTSSMTRPAFDSDDDGLDYSQPVYK